MGAACIVETASQRSMNPYLKSIYSIFSVRRFSNSYKPALARALVRLAPELKGRELGIAKADLAPVFLKYYWDLETVYRLRQSIDPDKDPIVMKGIRRRVSNGIIKQGESLDHFRKRSPAEYDKLVRFYRCTGKRW